MHREVGRDMRAIGRPGGRFGFAARRLTAHAARVTAVALLVGCVCALGLLLQATRAVPRPFAAPVAQAASHLAAPGSLTLVSPSSGQGPVGAHVTVRGDSWAANSVAIGAAQSAGNCASGTTWSVTFTTQPTSGGTFSATFIWPSSLSSGAYALCAAPAQGGGPAAAGGVAGQTYTVKASSPPALSLSTFNAQVGQTITINGSNFVGVNNVNISVVRNGAPTLITTVNPDGNGSFATQYQPTTADVGVNNVNITAASATDQDAPPALTAQASLVVGAAATATPSPSPSPSPSPTAEATATVGAVTTTNNTHSGGNGLIVLLIVGIVLSLLVIIGAVAFLMLRRRGGPEQGYPGGPGGPGGGYGGYSGTGQMTSYGQSATGYGPTPTGRYSTSGTFGRSGMFDVPGPYDGPQVGGVAQWDEPEPLPGADWQPRPMSGARSRYDDPNYNQNPTGYPAGGETGEPVPAPVPDHYGPPDPWANASGAFGGDAWGNNPPAGRPPRRSAAPQPGQGPSDPWQQQSGGRGDGAWNTRPGQGQPPEGQDDSAGRWQTRPENRDDQW